MPFSSQDCLSGTRLTIPSYNSLDPRVVWLNIGEATPSTAHRTCEFFNSMRLLHMLYPLYHPIPGHHGLPRRSAAQESI